MTNLLPLESWRRLMGFHPYHFWGLADTDQLRVNSGCDTLIRQHAWQGSDAPGRQEIAEAIETAEARLLGLLGYSVAPRYTSEIVPWPTYADHRFLRSGPYGADGAWLSVQLSEGEIRACGIEALAAIQAAAPVVYSDVDGDGYNDTFTVGPIATTVTDPSEIAVYFAATERYDGSAVGDQWRIQPVNVTISAGAVTIKGPAWLLVKPVKYEGIANIGANGLDPATVANFATTLDVYRRYTNESGTTTTTAQGVIVWETRPCTGWWCCCGDTNISTAYAGSPYDPAAVANAVARVGIRNAALGIVHPAEAAYNTTTDIWSSLDWMVCDQPDRVLIRYLAGSPLQTNGQMDAQLQVVVARLAAAELARPICGCDDANRELYRWQYDISRTAGANDEMYAVSPKDLDNPLGTRRGHIYAWKYIKDHQLIRGLLAG